MTTQIVHCINGAIATATSAWINIQGAHKVILIGQRSANAGGSTTFSGQLAIDESGTNVITYNKWIDNLTNTNGQTLTRVASKAISNADGAIVLSMSPEDIGGFLKITATEASDGTHNAYLLITRD